METKPVLFVPFCAPFSLHLVRFLGNLKIMHFSCIESMFQDGVYLIDTSEGSVKGFGVGGSVVLSCTQLTG